MRLSALGEGSLLGLGTGFVTVGHVVVGLFLGIGHLLPSGTEETADVSETGLGVVSLDALTLVLGEEHVCRERALGGSGVLLGLGGALLRRGRRFGLGVCFGHLDCCYRTRG